MARLRNDLSPDKITSLVVANHLRAANAPKRSQRRENINRLQNVRFPLRIIPKEQVQPGRELEIQPPVIAEVSQA